MTRGQWMLIFVLVIVLIVFFIVYLNRDKIFKKKETTGNNTTAQLPSDCNNLSYDETINVQTVLNNKGCVDYNGNALVVDGICGPLTNSALKNCNKPA